MLVSIIIPTYNVAHYVAEALDSAIAQTYRPIEIIAVDNNSTDGTLAILHEYEKRFPDLITVLQEPKQGAPAARNLGLKHAKGEWIQFLDADDLLLPGKVGRQVGLLRLNSKASMVWGAYKRQPWDNEEVFRVPLKKPWEALVGAYAGITSSNLWQQGSIRRAGGWDESWSSCQDYKLIFDILRRSESIAIDPTIGAIVRERVEGGQISDQDWSVIIGNEIKLRVLATEYLWQRPHPVSDEYWQLLFRYIRMYAGTNPVHALQLYQKYFPSNFRLKYRKGNKCSFIYVCAVNTMGYEQVEKNKNRLAKYINNTHVWKTLQLVVNGKKNL